MGKNNAYETAKEPYFILSAQVEVERFNKLYTKRRLIVPEAEFLVVASQQAEKLYGHVFIEICGQVQIASYIRQSTFCMSPSTRTMMSCK